ncbi:uncharacterized protein BYT42DRAFT_374757 [Radiomyces spectabilis]|uniref:uncharacterized protein n=1 Tax=Radiomyces spectabilis TaxID=64574 RepID=UPI00221F21CC|nr:uncharacterized protein BYT42DRAFT_374757 [Radiomyces spectabilis]KAI8376104.1 hypothetical protein BYT42DRAFT_374757 [Radiomyces spectabilis]
MHPSRFLTLSLVVAMIAAVAAVEPAKQDAAVAATEAPATQGANTAAAEPPVKQDTPVAVTEPSATQEPAANTEPSANQEPAANTEPSANQDPASTAATEPSANQEPSAVDAEASANLDPAAEGAPGQDFADIGSVDSEAADLVNEASFAAADMLGQATPYNELPSHAGQQDSYPAGGTEEMAKRDLGPLGDLLGTVASLTSQGGGQSYPQYAQPAMQAQGPPPSRPRRRSNKRSFLAKRLDAEKAVTIAEMGFNKGISDAEGFVNDELRGLKPANAATD